MENLEKIIKIQYKKIKELEEKVIELKCMLILSIIITLAIFVIGLFEVKNFVDNPQEYLPPNWVEIVEVPQLEELK